MIKKIDILFIDGDHSFDGVRRDFHIYSKYVNEGGYIVFDDYNDEENSPEVKLGVNSLNLSGYEILGEFGDQFGARPDNIKGNEYVIKKLVKDIKIGVVISTYYRPDGKTKFYLDRCLNSLKNQTYKNFKVFLIGDKYENESEFNDYSGYFDNMYIENLNRAKERERNTQSIDFGVTEV